VEWVLLQGFLRKVDAKTWCFDGQIVVVCVVDVESKRPFFGL
jgi:hypothetical protein